jgi:hypothetical protein
LEQKATFFAGWLSSLEYNAKTKQNNEKIVTCSGVKDQPVEIEASSNSYRQPTGRKLLIYHSNGRWCSLGEVEQTVIIVGFVRFL